MMVRHYYFKMSRTKASLTYKHVYTIYVTDKDFACVKPPPKKARTAIKDPDSERNLKTASASPNEVVDLTSSGSRKRLQKPFFFIKTILLLIIVSPHGPLCIQICNSTIYSWLLCYFSASLEDKLYERDLETALSLSLLASSRTQDGEPTTKTGECTTTIGVGNVSPGLHPKTEKCCLRRTHSKVGRHQGTSESKVSFTSCLMRYLHLIDFWRQHRCILRCLWYPTILCVPFRDGWAKQ